MSKIFKVAFLLALSMSCWSCGSNSNSSDLSKDAKLALVEDVLTLPLDSLTTAETFTQAYVKSPSGKDLLAFLNDPDNSLYYQDLETGKIVHKVAFQKDGPNRVEASRMGVYIHSYDTLVTAMGQSILYVNSQGEIFHKIDLSQYDQSALNGEIFLLFGSNGNYKPLFIDGKIYLPSTPPIFQWTSLPLKDIQNSAAVVEIDTVAKTIKNKLNFPAAYVTDARKIYFSAIEKSVDGDIVLNLSRSHDLYKWNGEELTVKSAKASILPQDDLPPSKADFFQDMEEFGRYFNEADSYGPLIFDPYKKVYYRLAYSDKTEEVKSFNEGFETPNYQGTKQSVLLLDANLNLIDELILPTQKFVVERYFVTPKGLYLSATHPRYDLLSEDEVILFSY